MLFILTACSKPLVSNRTVQNKTDNPETSGTRGPRMPDFGQPNREADIRGIVKSIIGNEATILKVDMKGGRGAGVASSTKTGADNTSETRQAPAVSLNGTRTPGDQGGRNFSGGQGGPGATTDRAAMLENLKAMSTGEETVLIPVGIQMLKSSLDSNTKTGTMVEASLSDIVSDKSITIWLNSSVTDRKVAEFVLIN